jgi:amino acid adenylation domain-containing protein/FkbH-like protein
MLAKQNHQRLTQPNGNSSTAKTRSEKARTQDPDVSNEAVAAKSGNPDATANEVRNGEAAPLSFFQQRIWLLNQLEPGHPAYNLVSSAKLEGPLNVKALTQTLNEILRRQEILRTTFTAGKTTPAQTVQAMKPVSLEPADLSGVPVASREAEVARLAMEEKNLPFDLARDLLFRVRLVRFSDREHALIIASHEIACDQASLEIILNEIRLLYASFCSGDSSRPKSPAMQYSRYAASQREQRPRGEWDAHIAFWKKQLHGAPALLELPADYPRPAAQSYRAGTDKIQISKEIAGRVRELSRELGMDEGVVFFAALTVLLQRYTRQDDIPVCIRTSARDEVETRNLAGNFENLMVLRTSLEGDPQFAELAQRVEAVWAEGLRNRKLPFQKILDELRPARDQSYHPLAQVLFNYRKDSNTVTEAAGLKISALGLPQGTTKFDLELQVCDDGPDFTAQIDYAADLFEPRTVRRILEHFETLIGGIVDNPKQRVSELRVLTSEEKRILLTDWTATQKEYPREKTLADLFEEQVARTPGAEAVVCGDVRLTYSELYERAGAVAAQLKALGVKQEDLVGICVERSWEMLAAILGTLLSGAAYVPMDPSYPKDRLGFMLEDADIKVLLTQKKLLGTLSGVKSTTLCVEDINWGQAPADADSTGRHIAPRGTADSLAYVIYTSGSTGRPKGVALEHRSAVAFVYWAKDVFTPEELSGVLASTSICFDLSVFEMFVPLSLGGRVILAENALALPSLPAANEVRLINTVPSAARELVRVKGIPASVRVINLAGEPLATSLVDALYEQTSVSKVYDLYGPTETTTYSTFTLRQPGKRATIGRPLANEQVYLLDPRMQPVPIGVVGELYIGGDGLARGYLNRPEMTAERFIPDPFKAGGRLYKTGDLARWRSDGNLEFLGRIDNQVKVRGFRIELGEIEAALRKQEGVTEAVVLAREDQPGQKRLVAYVAGAKDGTPTSDELRSAIRKALPEYMTPSAFVFLEALPLTPNGKADRKALPAPDLDSLGDASELIAPRTSTEEQVAAAWREVLQLKEIGVKQNFFDLGGDSLQAIQVISRIQEQFNINLPLSSLFDASTVESLAAGIESSRWGARKGSQTLLKPVSRKDRLPVSFVQERLWFFAQLLPDSHAYNVPAAWRLKGALNREALEKAINQIVRRHEALRTVFKYDQGMLSQVIAPELTIPIQFEDLEPLPASERETRARQLCNTEAAWHFDLSRGPLIRVCVARLDQEEHLLMVVMHHSVSDGWSLGVFAHELGIIYRALVAGEALPKLPELPVQYADFAAWQRKNMDGEMLKAESAFWKQKLAGAPAALELPTDHVERSEQSLKAGVSTLQINAGLSSALGQFSQAEGSTPFHSLMAALVMTLHKWTSQRDIVIGTVVAGRNRKEIENVIGCFMNFLPVRVKLSEEETANEVLGAVRTAVVEAQNHQDYPFEKMVEAINPERHLNRNPLYNVALLFQNYPMPRFESEGLTGNPLPAPLDEALLDLRFEAEQNESGLSVSCDYKADLFEPATIERLLGCFEQTLQSLVQEPGKKMRDLAGMTNASPGLRRDGEKLAKIAIASTFTAEPIADPLRYWLRELEIPAEVEFALFNQVFQELLDPSSLLMSNRDGLNVMLLRLEDWQHAGKREHKTTGEKARKEFEDESLERTVKDFALALRNAAAQGGTSWLVCLCPSSPTADLAQSERYERMEKKLADELEGLSGVYLLTSAELAHWYPVKDYYDVRGDELGHIPYTPLFFTALATGVARKYHALKRPVYKVIALDCDNTLWAGVCGEDGPKGIRLDAAFLALQKFIRAQQEAGVLLCACSKNNEADVREVFEQRQEMPLRAEHFAAWRLNWHPKSANLKSLAEELKLGLDSFIFVDDNPLECADVEANCPEVLTLQLPEDPAMIPQFLEHCWAFDHLKLTVEDRKRAEMYRQNKEREQLRTQSLSLGDFLAGLELRIAIEPMAEGQLPRVSQLTQRTNQFNFTTRRRSESDLRMLAGSAEVLTVSVSDRFGDYGLAGLVMFSVRNGALDVETFLLSCRVLGRGVEHRMLAHLGEVAHQRKLNWVDVHFSNSGRNRPGLEFLENVGAPFRQAQNGGYLFRFPTGFAAEVTFNPQSSEARAAETIKKPESGGDHNASVENNGARANRPEPLLSKLTRCREIALNLNDPEKIYQAMEAKSVKRQGKRAGYVPPQNDLERSLCGIWQKLLRIEKVGVHDNFFELGGHSLLAVRLFTEIETAVGRKLPLVTLFQSPTVRQLARVLDRGDAAAPHSLLVPLQPLGSKPPLFLVHGAGGDVLWGYANLTAHLAPDQPVYGIKSKGQAGQEEFSRIEDMAACYLKQIKAHQPQGPYFLGGYCFGGNVAFEMARQLGLHGEAVALVALLDSAPSNAGYEKVAWWRPDYAFRFARNATHWLRDFSELKSEDRRKFVTRKLSALGRKLRRRFGAARGSRTVDLEDIIDPTHFPENELKLWQIHLQALNAHIERPFEGKVLLLRTRGQPLFCSLEQDFRWGTLARAGVKVVITPGSHENIFMEPNVEALATHLQSALTEAQTS